VLVTLTKLLYVEPGYYWDGQLCMNITNHSGQLSLLPLLGREIGKRVPAEEQWQCPTAGNVTVGFVA